MSVLGYFPEIYDDEMLYSVVARYHRHVGNPAVSMSNLDLFGRTHIRSTFDMPSYVSDLAKRIPEARGLNAERLATEHTHMPYYVAFMPADRREALMAKQLSGYASLHMETGVNAFVVQQITSLRFCPDCVAEMLAEKGELWWKRAHQLPGVLVCHEHGCSLAQSGATFWTRGQHGFVAATLSICHEDAAKLIEGVGAWDMRRLLDVAKRCKALLRSTGEVTTLPEMSARYRARLLEKGLMKSKAQIDVDRLVDAFAAHHGGILSLIPGLLDREGRFDRWLLELVRTGRKATHPLQHVLLQSFLDGRPARVSPFGAGPWRCLNPVAGHGDDLTILAVREKKQKDCLTGTFECPCGYAYTMSAGDDLRMRGPRFKTFGPLLDPALIRLVEEGATLRVAAAKLGVHPRAIAAAAQRLRLGKRWKAPEKVGRRMGQAVPPAKAPRKASAKPAVKRKPPVPRVNWDDVDQRIAADVGVHAAKLLQSRPPVMVRMRSLETAMSRPNFIYARKAKLPLTMKAVADATETTDGWHRRRIAIALEEARGIGKVTVSGVLRAAGVKPGWRAYIKEMVLSLPAVGIN